MPVKFQPLFPVSGTDAALLQGVPVGVVQPVNGSTLVYDAASKQYIPVGVLDALTLQAPDGSRWQITVAANGTLTQTKL